MKTKHDSRILNSIFSVLQYFCIIFLHSMFLQYLVIFSNTQIFCTQYFYTQYLYTIFTLISYTPNSFTHNIFTLNISCEGQPGSHFAFQVVFNSKFKLCHPKGHRIWMTFSIFSRKFEIPNLIFTRIPFLFRDEGGVAHPPPAQNMLAHIPGSTVFESAGSLNRDLHFPGSTLLKSVEPRMCSHTLRD